MTPSEEKLAHTVALASAKRAVAFVADTSQPGCTGVQVSAEFYVDCGADVCADGITQRDAQAYRPWFIPWTAVWGIVDCDGPNDASAMRTWPKPPRPSRLPDGWRVIKGGVP